MPESIGKLTNLQKLDLNNNQLTTLPKSIGKLTNLQRLNLSSNQIIDTSGSIGKLTNLQTIELSSNQLTTLPKSIGLLINLQDLYLSDNPIADLSPLEALTQEDLRVEFFGVDLPRRYWTKFSDWQPEWLLDEDNAEIRRVLIQQLGYEKICERLGAETIDTWREYTLLKIDNIEAVYEDEDDENDEPSNWEALVMLKMTCPSTGHIHILRVPPAMTSAEAAITWVNHGIHPDKFSIQT